MQKIKDRVLIVDDQEEIRTIISRLISFLGYEVATASNGNEGLHLFSLSSFDLVITDLTMPGLNPEIDPDGLLEYSVVFTDRSLNHMSKTFRGVMNDISATLKDVYGADAAIPRGGPTDRQTSQSIGCPKSSLSVQPP